MGQSVSVEGENAQRRCIGAITHVSHHAVQTELLPPGLYNQPALCIYEVTAAEFIVWFQSIPALEATGSSAFFLCYFRIVLPHAAIPV